ncbi:MAG TPA: hypothetical protein VKE51_26260 [Vicinamibacterales bacterium]|nr:hypothetical protein [Vicinamibacterales bacterium]
MSATDFLRMPPGVQVLVLVLLWPAIWAGALLAAAFAGDLIRRTRPQPAPVARRALVRE